MVSNEKVHTKFLQTQSLVSNVEKTHTHTQTHRQHESLIRLFFPKEKLSDKANRRKHMRTIHDHGLLNRHSFSEIMYKSRGDNRNVL
jgi:hypothetical protein